MICVPTQVWAALLCQRYATGACDTRAVQFDEEVAAFRVAGVWRCVFFSCLLSGASFALSCVDYIAACDWITYFVGFSLVCSGDAHQVCVEEWLGLLCACMHLSGLRWLVLGLYVYFCIHRHSVETNSFDSFSVCFVWRCSLVFPTVSTCCGRSAVF